MEEGKEGEMETGVEEGIKIINVVNLVQRVFNGEEAEAEEEVEEDSW